MRCHVFHAQGSYAVAGSGMGFGYSIRFRQHSVFGTGLPLIPVLFGSLRSRPASGGTLIRAYPVRPCRRGSRARLRGREPSAGRTSPVGRIGGLFAPVPTRKARRPPDTACPAQYDLYLFLVKLIEELLLKFNERYTICGLERNPAKAERLRFPPGPQYWGRLRVRAVPECRPWVEDVIFRSSP